MNKSDKPERVYAFIDSQNLNVGVQKFGWKMDWRKFRQWLTDQYGVTKAYMFIGYVPENESLYEQMHEAGYAVVLKPTFDLTRPRPEEDKDEERPIKGNVDADLVLWVMKEMSNYEKAIIVSGDGDYYSLVEYLAGKKRLLKLLTPSSYYSQLYHAYEEYVVVLDKFKRDLRYHDRKRILKKGKPAKQPPKQ